MHPTELLIAALIAYARSKPGVRFKAEADFLEEHPVLPMVSHSNQVVRLLQGLAEDLFCYSSTSMHLPVSWVEIINACALGHFDWEHWVALIEYCQNAKEKMQCWAMLHTRTGGENSKLWATLWVPNPDCLFEKHKKWDLAHPLIIAALSPVFTAGLKPEIQYG